MDSTKKLVKQVKTVHRLFDQELDVYSEVCKIKKYNPYWVVRQLLLLYPQEIFTDRSIRKLSQVLKEKESKIQEYLETHKVKTIKEALKTLRSNPTRSKRQEKLLEEYRLFFKEYNRLLN